MRKLISATIGIIALSSAVSAHAQQAPAYNAGWQPVVVADQPVVVSTGTSTTGGTYNSGWIQNQNGQVMNPNNGMYMQNGQVYLPQQTANINYTTSGCQRNLGNALACMFVQGVVQAGVNRSAVREQAAATIQVQRAQFTLQNGGGQPVYSAAPPASAGGICRLTMPDGRSQDIRVQSAAECQQAIAQAGGVMRQ